MRFSLLLFGLHFILKNAAKKNEEFKHYIRKASVRVLIKTADGKRARLFVFDRGNVTSRSGDAEDFDVALVWSDAATGFSVMLDKNKDASFKAAAENKLKIVGMSVYAQWFEDAMKLVQQTEQS